MTDAILRPGGVALVTGASSGIGLAIAERLLAKGVRVIAVSRRREALETAFAKAEGPVLIYPLDVTDGAAVAALPDSLPADWQQIDALVVNAGSDVGGRQAFLDGKIEDFARTIETNVTGVLRTCHAVMPGMLARGRGHVVIIGSIAGEALYLHSNVYAASKHAVHAFTGMLRLDYRNSPLRITEVLPGMVKTGFAAARHGGDTDKAETFYDSFKAILAPDDIAASVLFALEQPLHVNIAQITVTPTGDM